MPEPHSDASLKVGRRIAQLRHAATLSAKKLAECADLDLTHLQRIEKGAGNPTLYTLLQIAVALEVEVGELLVDLDAEDLPQGRRPYGYSRRDEFRRQPRTWG
ncbi:MULTISPECIES: helix-turn-helix domain-containing protein [Microbacterium]|uniref:HTH cro/C1-type domain-containing protein n=1 Tax=Microbacterium barkeri TaxID=33917 RepID=A0A9W6H0F9_9MICO|nr:MULTISPECIES: helix-turn-helix transcriptional regulator [Microbacterium]MDI6941883.1 helix-turn-helix transcriptional regulator [Microbacterium barkeri]MDR6875757.1 transcriptional regulator with XRE-family HTH domain [Microbacterium barkeri]GLJ59873.1 hypothetical protein GCM10017576_00020 [Microbacterium barkeri]